MVPLASAAEAILHAAATEALALPRSGREDFKSISTDARTGSTIQTAWARRKCLRRRSPAFSVDGTQVREAFSMPNTHLKSRATLCTRK
jgi:hypothetical protein